MVESVSEPWRIGAPYVHPQGVPHRGDVVVRRPAPSYTEEALMKVLTHGVTLTLCVAALWHCSAGGSKTDPASVGTNPDGVPQLPNTPGGPGTGPEDVLLPDDGPGIDQNGNPTNIGTELACDGIDENENGIVDDVDKGTDIEVTREGEVVWGIEWPENNGSYRADRLPPLAERLP